MSWVEEQFKKANHWMHETFGLSTPDDPNGASADIHVGGTTSTDMGYDLEGKNTALTMGEMAPGEYTEMYGNNTAYNEEKENNGTNYVKDLISPLLTGAATAYINNYFNRRYQHEQNEFNAGQAQLNRDWEEHMANTAHQREMADLLATGLNPVNTATGGGGAATPGGSAAAGTTPPYMDANSVGNTALSLAETLKVLNENKYISKEKKAQIANTVADTAEKEAGKSNTEADTKKKETEIENIKEQKKLIQKQLDLLSNEEKAQVIELARAYQSAKTEEEKRRLEEMFYKSGFGAFMHHVGTTLGEIGQIIGAGTKVATGKKGGLTINNNTIN